MSTTKSDFWNKDRTDTLTKDFVNLHKHEGSFQTSLKYGYFISKHQFGWPAPDEAWQVRSQTFIGWPACKGKMLKKNPVHFFGSLRIPVHFFGSLRILVHFSGSFFRFIKNPGSFLRLISRNASSFLTFTKIVHDAHFFELKIPVFTSTQHFSWPLLTSRGRREYGEGCSERNASSQILVSRQGSSRPSGWVRGQCHRA